MILKNDFKNYSGIEAWNYVTNYINNHGSFFSVNGIKYEAQIIGASIYFKGGDSKNRGGYGEYLVKDKFIYAFNSIKSIDNITTGSVKPFINRQQSPFVGLLKSTGMIE